MRRFTVRILIAVLTFTAGVVVSKFFVFSGSEYRSFRSSEAWELNGKRRCKPRRSYSRFVATRTNSTRFEPVPVESFMRPSQEGYSEAMEFAEFLRGGGIEVQSVNRSKLEGLFQQSRKAAFLRTDSGPVEVLFLPDANGAEKIRVTEHRHSRGYRYSLTAPDEFQTMDSGLPNYFIRHQNWFIMTQSERLAEDIKFALAR